MNIALQIKIIREHFCGGSNKEFAEFMGENVNTTSNWVSSETIGINVVEKIISKFPDVNPGWLLTGEGDMLKSQTVQKIGNMHGGIGAIGHVSGNAITGKEGDAANVITENERLREDNRKLLDQVIKLTERIGILTDRLIEK